MKYLKTYENMKESSNNSICLTCGTNEQDDNGLCINGHDDWLEEYDYEPQMEIDSKDVRERARKYFNKSDEEILDMLKEAKVTGKASDLNTGSLIQIVDENDGNSGNAKITKKSKNLYYIKHGSKIMKVKKSDVDINLHGQAQVSVDKLYESDTFLHESVTINDLYIICYGLGGSFGGADQYEVVEADDIDDAEKQAYEKACEEYENYDGMYGLQSMEEIMEEEDVEQDEAYQMWIEERESWLDYYAEKWNKELEEKAKNHHYQNDYSEITDKLSESDTFSGGGAYPGPNLINNDPSVGTGGSIGGENTPIGAEWKGTGPSSTPYPNKFIPKIKKAVSKESRRRKSAMKKLMNLDKSKAKIKMKSFDDFQKEKETE